MSTLHYNSSSIDEQTGTILFNGTDLDKVYYNNTLVWEKSRFTKLVTSGRSGYHRAYLASSKSNNGINNLTIAVSTFDTSSRYITPTPNPLAYDLNRVSFELTAPTVTYLVEIYHPEYYDEDDDVTYPEKVIKSYTIPTMMGYIDINNCFSNNATSYGNWYYYNEAGPAAGYSPVGTLERPSNVMKSLDGTSTMSLSTSPFFALNDACIDESWPQTIPAGGYSINLSDAIGSIFALITYIPQAFMYEGLIKVNDNLSIQYDKKNGNINSSVSDSEEAKLTEFFGVSKATWVNYRVRIKLRMNGNITNTIKYSMNGTTYTSGGWYLAKPTDGWTNATNIDNCINVYTFPTDIPMTKL